MPGPRKQSFAKPKNAKGTFRRILKYFKPYRGQLVLVLIGLLVSVAANIAGTYMLRPIINEYIIPWIGNENPDFTGLIGQLAVMAAVYTIGILGTFMYNRLMINVSTGTLLKLRLEMFTKMQTLPISYFDGRTHGEIMSTYTNDTDVMREMISQGLPSFISSAVRIVGVFTMMIVLNPILTGIAILMLVIMMLITKAIAGRSGRFFKARQDSVGKVNGYIEEMIEGQKVIKVFNHEAAAKAGFTGLNDTYRDAATRAQAYAGAMMPAMGNLSHINYAITCCIGGLLAIRTGDLGGLSAFLQYTKQVSQPITQISQQVNTILSAVAGAERVFEIMEAEPEVDDGKVTLERVKENADGTLSKADYDTGAWAWKKSDGSLVPLRGDVRFDHVVFGYDDRKIILHDISLFAKPGQKIAFVGSTGAGKTTITSLINRFYEIQSGTITYDGIDVRDIQKDSLRRSLGVVLQDTHLFTGTVADNIRYGRLDATDEEVEAAARLAGADGFIRHLPQGYDTVITGDGAGLSQGERQLLAIARAAVSDPPVLILDEATSSIDTRTENLIEQGMDSLMEGRTVFVIAHRLSTVRNSQAILVLEHGRIIERGDHQELLAQQGKYYQLYTGKAELS